MFACYRIQGRGGELTLALALGLWPYKSEVVTVCGGSFFTCALGSCTAGLTFTVGTWVGMIVGAWVGMIVGAWVGIVI
jgi:hypothetical protein